MNDAAKTMLKVLGLEQRSMRVIWALHFEAVASWRAEVFRRDNALSLSFTEGDRLNGHRQDEIFSLIFLWWCYNIPCVICLMISKMRFTVDDFTKHNESVINQRKVRFMNSYRRIVQCFMALMFILPLQLQADVKSSTGNLSFYPNQGGLPEMILDSTGLSIGTTVAQSNLHVTGNVIISDKLDIGGTSGGSNLNIHGTIGFGITSTSSNLQLDDSMSIVLADTSNGNIQLTLPYAGNCQGRIYTIKKTSINNSLWISGGGNAIDSILCLERTQMQSAKFISSANSWYLLDGDGSTGEIASDNLVGWWKMDEASGATTAVDSGPYGFDGTLNGMSFSDNVGIYERAAPFDLSAYIDVGNDSRLNPTNITVMAWIYCTGNTSNVYSIVTDSTTGDKNGYLFEINYGNKLSVSGSGNWNKINVNSPLVSMNEWTHVAFSYDGATLRAFINGAKVQEVAEPAPMNLSAAQTRIGGRGNSSSDFIGLIDSVRIYNRALTEGEVQAIYRIKVY